MTVTGNLEWEGGEAGRVRLGLESRTICVNLFT
jgi:hypothetical protein